MDLLLENKAPTTPIRALFVDDEPKLVEAIALSMRRERFAIATATSAKAALEQLASAEFDVVVSDERMPGTSGSSFLTEVRRRWPRTARIMLSGQADVRATLAAINEAHVFRFLTKPCSPSDLAFCIRQAVAAAHEPNEADPATGAARSPAAVVEPLAPFDAAEFERLCGTLWMAYHSIVDAHRGTVVACEALVRSDDATFGNADQFIRRAEQAGVVEAVDRRIRALVAADLPQLDPAWTVLVNLHPRSLRDPSLYERDDPLHPFRARIVLEITERENLAGMADLAARTRRLRDLGYRVAVDDLGAGYAGLSTFTTVVPDVVKFDQGLVRDCDGSPTKRKLLESMASLCRELDIRTIAEGVETEAERRCVVAAGCDLIQGYLFGKPQRRTSR